MNATLGGAQCVVGAGVVLDGVDDYVDLADVARGGAVTIAALVRWDAYRDSENNNGTACWILETPKSSTEAQL